MSGYIRDTIIHCIAIAIVCMVCAFSATAYFIPIWRQAQSLENIATELQSIDQAIRMQTAQQSWLVSHYMKPVRPLFPWEKHRCEWCGQEKLEGDDE